jgi:CubicO group peptidase (beta-lactamase class C family)
MTDHASSWSVAPSPRRFWIFVACVVIEFAAVGARAQDRFENIRTMIRHEIVDDNVPSVSVAVAQHGKIIWEQSFGWADREHQISASPDTMYSLASISKPLTATALMTLVQAGRVRLDAPINSYLDAAKLRARVGNERDATVRRVANHTSGLPLHAQFFYSDEGLQAPTEDETILRYGNLVTVPGEHFQYSNLGFGILGYIISRVSGEAFEEYMHNHVFLRLGMLHTAVGIPDELRAYAAARYDSAGTPIPYYITSHPGASEIYSSAHDLIRFAMFSLKDHLEGQSSILSDQVISEMQNPTAHVSTEQQYGIGWFIEDRGGIRSINHSGSMPGVSTDLVLVPSADLAVVVLINTRSETAKAWDISDAILKVILPQWRAGVSYASSAKLLLSPVPSNLIGQWKGTLYTYEKQVPVVLDISNTGELQMKIGDQLVSLVNNVEYRDETVTGDLLGEVPINDMDRRRPYYLTIRLKHTATSLAGSISAIAEGTRRAALSQWVELAK